MMRARPSTLTRLLIALVAIAGVFYAVLQLNTQSADLKVTQGFAGATPITAYEPPGTEPLPVAILAHGFAGSRQMMQPLAITLANQGFLAVTLDFAGHGANTQPFIPTLLDPQGRRLRLLSNVADAMTFIDNHPRGSSSLALLGHSMAGDILLQYAAANPGRVHAHVLISPYIAEDTEMAELGNLLFLFGAYEPPVLWQATAPAFPDVDSSQVLPGLSVGDIVQGDAREIQLIDGAEHISVIYRSQTLLATLEWVSRSAGVSVADDPALASRGLWLGLLFGSIIVLAAALSGFLPAVTNRPLGASLPWREIWPVVLVPAIATPILLLPVPLGLLPLLLSDYLAMHFALYGLLTLLGLFYLQSRTGAVFRMPFEAKPVSYVRLLLALLFSVGFVMLAFGLPIQAYLGNYWPVGDRAWLVAVIFGGTTLFFVADEWLTRGQQAARGAYAVTKLLFLASLMLAVALRLYELFFLIIILPAMGGFLLIYGLLSRWMYRATRHPLVGALTVSLALAWAMSVSFPLVGD
ncbi:Serine aminopeptidase, S33 [Ectothiorhodosinus mongolicus]|uniref:Serine aminopeptidase, S33 n=1 Tax=Ectothiorhodosinus mongolicus TaxID=233100 RepID=A0A1R3VM75_9GAMM|nr:alpha/beta fold hydrolase [Ectothiorhodosinus mongolicus]ULX57793.1 alpha/beta hydrolase [Ectothiorhodosinus mongolicus]SIT65657.1 Serine aminopeptidase, S33 [Ectothiorhodosinus mongolicus]